MRDPEFVGVLLIGVAVGILFTTWCGLACYALGRKHMLREVNDELARRLGAEHPVVVIGVPE